MACETRPVSGAFVTSLRGRFGTRAGGRCHHAGARLIRSRTPSKKKLVRPGVMARRTRSGQADLSSLPASRDSHVGSHRHSAGSSASSTKSIKRQAGARRRRYREVPRRFLHATIDLQTRAVRAPRWKRPFRDSVAGTGLCGTVVASRNEFTEWYGRHKDLLSNVGPRPHHAASLTARDSGGNTSGSNGGIFFRPRTPAVLSD